MRKISVLTLAFALALAFTSLRAKTILAADGGGDVGVQDTSGDQIGDQTADTTGDQTADTSGDQTADATADTTAADGGAD